ncbi:MAG: translocation/assembly module TamB domain-containing protein [Pseudomonadota bacterium]
MRMKQSHHFRRTIAVIALMAGFVSACVWIVNRPEVLAHALAVANAKSDWKIDVEKFTWQPLSSKVLFKGISIRHKSTGKNLKVDQVKFIYRLLGLLRGRFVIDELVLSHVNMRLPPSEKPKEKKARRRIDPAKFLIFKHIELTEGRIEGLSLLFGKDASLKTDEMRLALIPSIFGDNRLAIRADGINLTKGEHSVLSAGFISLKTSTRIEQWINEFPYINDISGKLSIADAKVEGLRVEKAGAEIKLKNEKLSLTDLNIMIENRELLGKATANIDDESFELAIDIPEPMSVPHIGKPMKTIDTAGHLSGSIRLSGKGFVPSQTSGSGSLDLSHRFSKAADSPVRVNTKLTWHHGVFNIAEAQIAVGEDVAHIRGSIDVQGKRMDLAAKGTKFHIEHLFNKFHNPHLAKIFGTSDFEASISGWGKNFKADVHGTTYDGGWKPIKAKKIVTELTATYDDLHLKGTTILDDHEVGKADLNIKFGSKLADGTRRKDIDLKASITDMDLAYALGEWQIQGTGNGTITLSGPHTAFTGVATAAIEKGKFHGLPFDRASAGFDITRKKIEFRDIELGLPKAEVSKFAGKLEADLYEGRMHLYGEPLKGLTVDAAYLYDPSRWNIASIVWNDQKHEGDKLELTGSLTSGGPLDMKAKGHFDASLIQAILSSLRDTSGPIDLDLAIRGTSSSPRLFGSIKFDKTALILRDPRVEFTSLSGLMRFDGGRVEFDDISAEMEDGTAKLSGYLDHRDFKPSDANLSLEAKGMRYRTKDGAFNMEVDGGLALKGVFPTPTLSGDVTIVEGKYIKDFTIIDMLAGKKKKKTLPKETAEKFNPKLALRVRNTGDMEIKNNVGEIFLNVNIDVSGTRVKPEITGSIDTAGGEVHYLGLSFDITKGFVEFRGKGDKPYLEVYAQKEVNVYNVNLILYGPIDNLALDLSATSPSGPLLKRDVVSLLLFGTTEQERDAAGRASPFGTSMAATSVGGIMGAPITRFTHLDTFRLESAEPESGNISRLNIGKQISDRLTVKFATDIGVDNTVQTFAAEYLITDNLLIEGQRSTDSRYKMSGILRFRLR